MRVFCKNQQYIMATRWKGSTGIGSVDIQSFPLGARTFNEPLCSSVNRKVKIPKSLCWYSPLLDSSAPSETPGYAAKRSCQNDSSTLLENTSSGTSKARAKAFMIATPRATRRVVYSSAIGRRDVGVLGHWFRPRPFVYGGPSVSSSRRKSTACKDHQIRSQVVRSSQAYFITCIGSFHQSVASAVIARPFTAWFYFDCILFFSQSSSKELSGI